MKQDTVQLKVVISRDVSRRLKRYVNQKYPDLLRGPLSIVVEDAIISYISSESHTRTSEEFQELTPKKEKTVETKEQKIQPVNYSVSSSKYNILLETIKRYSNSQHQITSGLAKKAIKEIIGKDDRTVKKYLKILQEDDILYANSELGVYDIQSWVLGDYNDNWKSSQQQELEITTI